MPQIGDLISLRFKNHALLRETGVRPEFFLFQHVLLLQQRAHHIAETLCAAHSLTPFRADPAHAMITCLS